MRSTVLSSLKQRLGRKDQDIPEQATLGAGINHPQKRFDLKKMNYEATRREKRHKLLLWSLPVVIIAGLLALWFLLPTPLTYKSIKNYKHKSYSTARHWLIPLTWTSPQHFVAAFDSGTEDAQLGNYDRAEGELNKALTLAKPSQRCMVLQNIVITLTDHATSLKAQGEGVESTGYTTVATNIKTTNKKCFKLTSPTPKGGGGGGGGGGGSQSQNDQVLTPAQQEQLQQKDQQGQASEQQDFKQNTVSPNSPNIKPW
jgi:hypothetical protein